MDSNLRKYSFLFAIGACLLLFIVIGIILHRYLQTPRQSHRQPTLEEADVFNTLERKGQDLAIAPTSPPERKDTLVSVLSESHLDLPDPAEVLPSPINISRLELDDKSLHKDGLNIPYRKSSLSYEDVPRFSWKAVSRNISVLSRNASTNYTRQPKRSYLMEQL
jgi:hypothetical protein